MPEDRVDNRPHQRLRLALINRVAFCERGSNGLADIVLYKSDDVYGDETYIAKKNYSTSVRIDYAKKGWAIPVKDADGNVIDGRYPIGDRGDVEDAVLSFGRGSAGDKPTIQAHITKNAKRLGATDLLPSDWTGSTKKAAQTGPDSKIQIIAPSTPAAMLSHVKNKHGIASPRGNPFKAHDTAHANNSYGDAGPHSHPAKAVDVDKKGRKLADSRRARLASIIEEAQAILAETTPSDSGTSGGEPAGTGARKEDATMPEKKTDNEIDVSSLPEAAQKFIADLRKERDEAVAAAEAKVEPAKPDGEDAFAKALADESLSDEVKAAIRKARDDSANAAARTAALEIAKRDDEWVAVVKDWKGLTAEPNEMGVALRKVADADADLGKELRRLLTAANATVESSDAWREVGKNGGRAGVGDALEKLRLAAVDLQKEDPKLTLSKAMEIAQDRNPDLAKEYREEQGIRTGEGQR